MKERIYIAGGGGMLGEAFYKRFNDSFDLKVTDIDTNEPWISYLDFRDLASYREDVISFGADYLFHLGAHTDLEYCEQNMEDAYLTNTISVQHAVTISNELNIPLIFISTAGIFDGLKDVYDEEDIPNPLGHYARSKYNAEKFVLENKQQCLVCRAGWMMGGGPGKDKKFVGKILGQIKSGQQELHIVNDKFGTPTYTHDFAATVRNLFDQRHWGLYHVVCEGETSRMEIAREIVRLLHKDNDISVNEVSSDFFKSEYFAPRPASERLVNARLKNLKLDRMRNWKTCLKEYLDGYYQDQVEMTGTDRERK